MSQIDSNFYINALIDGNEKVVLKIYENIFPKVKYFIMNNKGNCEDAQEIFQKALFQLTARAKVKKFVIESSFEGYVFTACKNLWRRQLNNQKKEVRNNGVFELINEEQDNARAIFEQERWELFDEKLNLLSKKCQDLLNAYFKKTSYKDIVLMFGYASENAAFQRVFKCKKRLKDLVMADNKYQKLC